MTSRSEIIQALQDAATSATCEHEFGPMTTNKLGGQVKTCRKCRCRFTSYPGSDLYVSDSQSGG